MTELEYKAWRWAQLKNIVVVIATFSLTFGLYSLSNSWISLVALLGLFFTTSLRSS